MTASKGALLLGTALVAVGCAGPPAPPPAPPVAAAESADAPRAITVITPEPANKPTTDGAVLLQGTGRFVNVPQPLTQQSAGVVGDGEDVTVSFTDADVREVVQAILGDFLGASFAIAPEVKGKITLQTARPIPRRDLVRVLDEVLRMSNAALVEGDGLYRVVPLAEAKGKTAPQVSGRRGVDLVGYGMRIIPLDHISAREMAKVLEPMIPAEQIVALDDERNTLLLSGTPAELDNLVEVVDIFDVDWLQGMSFGIVPIAAVDADTMVAELDEVFGGEDGPLKGMVRFVPLRRLRSVMVIASRPQRLQQAREWIRQLDRAGESEVQRLFVYRVQHGRSGDLGKLLSDIFEPDRSADGDTVGAIAPGAQQVQIVAQKGSLASKEDDDGTTSNGRRAQTPSKGGKSGTFRVNGGGKIRVVSDEKTNSLVIYATARDYRLVEEALQELDRVPLQVLIEATIAEVGLSDDLRYGLQWFFEAGSNQFRFSTAATGVVAPQFPGFAYVGATSSIRVVLDALNQVTAVNVLSAPKLVVLDNEVARLQVGDQVPVPVQSAVSVINPEAPIVNTIQFRDTGIILEVIPRISSAGTVTMEVRQEVSDVVGTTTSGIDAPTIQQRSILSTIAVESGQTVALGGLIRDRKSNGRSGIPLLMDVPVVGNLFSSTNQTIDRTELLVLISPKIIRSPVESRKVTEEMRRRMRSLERAREWVEQ